MPEEKQPTLLEKLNAVIGKEGLKTELKITLTTETMFKMVIANIDHHFYALPLHVMKQDCIIGVRLCKDGYIRALSIQL